MIEQVVTKNLLALADAYAKATGKSMLTIGKEFYGGSYFFTQLRAGETSISVRRLDKMLKAFRDEWPDGAKWPALMPVIMLGPKKR